MSINFPEGEVKISGHVKLGGAPTLASGTWNGRSLDEVSEGQLRGIIERLIALKDEKFGAACGQ